MNSIKVGDMFKVPPKPCPVCGKDMGKIKFIKVIGGPYCGKEHTFNIYINYRNGNDSIGCPTESELLDTTKYIKQTKE